MTFALVANPESLRARLFREAVEAEVPGATLVMLPWAALARGEIDLTATLPQGATLRIDSAGQDLETEHALLALGRADRIAEGGDAAVFERSDSEHGLIRGPRQAHLGFLRALERIEAALAERPDVRVMTAPSAIRELFDKRVTSRRWEAAGIPVPRRIEPIAHPLALKEAMERDDLRSAIVKVVNGSSASCLAVVQRPERELVVMSTVELRGSRRYNSRKLRRYTGEAALAVLSFLFAEVAVVERLVPKARIRRAGEPGPGQGFDMRVLVVGGQPAFVVGRASSHPITNLHLGGRRISEAELRGQCDSAALDGALEDAVRAGSFYDALHVGVDVALVARGGGHVVFEANAFGDHLNGVTKDGLDPHRFELRAFAARRSCKSPPEGARSSTPSPNAA